MWLCRQWILLALLAPCLSSCGSTEVPDSSLNIDSGRFITNTSENKVPGVVSIGGCTATAVADNTLITAGHCVSEGGRVCIRSGSNGAGACTNQVYTPSGWKQRRWAEDIAVAVFPNGTFKHYFQVASEPVQRGADVVMVGYSQYSIAEADRGKGSKRWGRNVVSRFDPGEVIITDYGSSADRVAVNPGDSGGPMFHQCKLVGVTSRTNGYGTFRGKTSLHTGIQYERNMNFLRSVEQRGAVYCGITATDGERCPANGRADVIADATGETFPCSETGMLNTRPVQRLNGLVSGTGDAVDIFIAASTDVESVQMCNSVAGDCQGAGDVGFTYHMTKDGLRFFKSTSKVDLTGNLREFVAVGFSAGKTLHSKTKIRIEKQQ